MRKIAWKGMFLDLLTEMHHHVRVLSITSSEKRPAVSMRHRKVIEDERGASRLEGFSDGVIAVAITLLVLDLHVPDVKAGLFGALLRQWPTYLGYITSFLVIGILWLHPHHIFTYIKRTDHMVLFLNMLLLMSVVLIPFVTALLTRYLNQQEEKTAALMYSGTFLLTTILFNVLWGYAAGHQRLLRPEIDPQLIRKLTRRYLLAPLLYLFSLPLTQVNVKACLVLYILVALFYTLPADRLQLRQRNDISQERMASSRSVPFEDV
jgi:uncharacterized membrane protein